MANIDFVTVCFGNEANLLVLQARSMALYLEPSFVGSIFLIIDRNSTRDFVEHLMTDVIPEYRHLRGKVRLIHFADITPSDRGSVGEQGWFRQQALKLLAARHVESKRYVMLDGKNHFIRPVQYADFIAPDGRIKATKGHPEGLIYLFNRTMKYWEVDPEEALRHTITAAAPYVADTKTVRDMLTHIEKTEGKTFYLWFLPQNGMIRYTENYLIQGYLMSKGFDLDSVYVDRPPMVAGFTEETCTREDFKDAVNNALNTPSINTMFVHHRAINELSPSGIYQIGSKWLEAGLIRSHRELDVFLRPSSHVVVPTVPWETPDRPPA